MANCLGVDLYSDGAAIPDDVLAALAHLDPDGDAIRVRVFTGTISAYDAVKGPASADSKAIATPSPGGRQEAPDDPLETKEAEQSAHYDLPPGGE